MTKARRLATILTTAILLANLLNTSLVTAQEEAEVNIDGLLYPFYDPTSESCETSVGTNSVGNNVYMIGDSWLYAMMEANPSIETALSNRGLTLLKANAVVGRSINGPGQASGGVAAQNGWDALQADANLIETAGKIVVILGTNSDSYANDIREFIVSMGNEQAQKYWVNTSANRSDLIEDLNGANTAIQNNATAGTGSRRYDVIDWFSRAFPGGDPTNIDPNAVSPYMSDDQVHPNASGYTALMEMIVNTLAGSNTGGSGLVSGAASRSSLPAIAQERLAAVESRVLQNQPAYEAMAAAHSLPWQVFAALHYREAGNDPTRSILGGERLGERAVDTDNTPQTLEESGRLAYDIFVNNARSIYEVDITSSSTAEDLKLAFLAYNRGSLYKNVPPNEGGPWGPDLSPYVMNLFDQNFLGPEGDGMAWPVSPTTGNWGVRGRWGEPIYSPSNMAYSGPYPVTNSPAGAMTFMAYFGLSGSSAGGCEGIQDLVSGTFTWPVAGAGGSPTGTLKACWSDFRIRTVSGGSYYHSGIDISAATGTDIVAMQTGTVVFAGNHGSEGYGNLVIIQHNGPTPLWSHYGHMDTIAAGIQQGTSVRAGQKIGTLGNTGLSTGPHLHLNLYDTWPFGPLPSGAANSNGQQTLNALTHGLSIPPGVTDEADCASYPEGGRRDYVAI